MPVLIFTYTCHHTVALIYISLTMVTTLPFIVEVSIQECYPPLLVTSYSISITELENIPQAQVFVGSSGFRLCFQFVLFLTSQLYLLENRATEF